MDVCCVCMYIYVLSMYVCMYSTVQYNYSVSYYGVCACGGTVGVCVIL